MTHRMRFEIRSENSAQSGLVVYVLFWTKYILLSFGIGIVHARYKDESVFDIPEFIVRKPDTAITIIHLVLFFVVFTSPAWCFYLLGLGTEF